MYGLGFQVEGLGCMVSGFRLRVWDVCSRMSGFEWGKRTVRVDEIKEDRVVDHV